MEKIIGFIENNYQVSKNGRKFTIGFKVGNNLITIENFKFYDEFSEETLAFKGDLCINNECVGSCSNRGCGGCADYYLTNRDMINGIEEEIRQIDNYSFPKTKLNLHDVLDSIANIMVMFDDNNVKTITKARETIHYLQKIADDYRTKYGN